MFFKFNLFNYLFFSLFSDLRLYKGWRVRYNKRQFICTNGKILFFPWSIENSALIDITRPRLFPISWQTECECDKEVFRQKIRNRDNCNDIYAYKSTELFSYDNWSDRVNGSRDVNVDKNNCHFNCFTVIIVEKCCCLILSLINKKETFSIKLFTPGFSLRTN